MAVHQDGSGRRSVQVEVEVPGTPERVWAAVASAEGISSWFVPTTFAHDAKGDPVEIISNFGPGMESVARVTRWDPPRSFSAESADLGPDAPVVATRWTVEPCGETTCMVRVEHDLVADSDAWDAQLEAWEKGWPDFFRLLRMYLANFDGQPCSSFQIMAMTAASRDAAWQTLLEALGMSAAAVGRRVRSSGEAPELAGTVERVGEPVHPEEMLVHLESPTPGMAHLFAMKMGEQVVISIRLHLFGSAAAEVVAHAEPRWQAWLDTTFAGARVPSNAGAEG